ncbi:hypothetical protein BBJ28_00022770 [Nothophytophthora sp. Chile5]|nr:hypothetical protein BBJ28_00022770 [Nothophytophthora sp. Chile5]
MNPPDPVDLPAKGGPDATRCPTCVSGSRVHANAIPAPDLDLAAVRTAIDSLQHLLGREDEFRRVQADNLALQMDHAAVIDHAAVLHSQLRAAASLASPFVAFAQRKYKCQNEELEQSRQIAAEAQAVAERHRDQLGELAVGVFAITSSRTSHKVGPKLNKLGSTNWRSNSTLLVPLPDFPPFQRQTVVQMYRQRQFPSLLAENPRIQMSLQISTTQRQIHRSPHKRRVSLTPLPYGADGQHIFHGDEDANGGVQSGGEGAGSEGNDGSESGEDNSDADASDHTASDEDEEIRAALSRSRSSSRRSSSGGAGTAESPIQLNGSGVPDGSSDSEVEYEPRLDPPHSTLLALGFHSISGFSQVHSSRIARWRRGSWTKWEPPDSRSDGLRPSETTPSTPSVSFPDPGQVRQGTQVEALTDHRSYREGSDGLRAVVGVGVVKRDQKLPDNATQKMGGDHGKGG